MVIPAMALLQQHDAQRDILIEPAAQQRAAIEARGHSELGHSELGAQSGCKNLTILKFHLIPTHRQKHLSLTPHKNTIKQHQHAG